MESGKFNSLVGNLEIILQLIVSDFSIELLPKNCVLEFFVIGLIVLLPKNFK